MKVDMKKVLCFLGMLILSVAGIGCGARQFDALSPFSTPGETASQELGARNLSAVLDQGGKSSQSEKARHALEVMGSYRRAQAPQPTYPVIQPAEVRLMWVPDHLNRAGDLVPAHYYYLKVLNDRWAVQDAFDLERQLNEGSAGNGSATPWIYGR